jgi:glutamate synthase (NADPH/NADH) large chain
MTALLANSHSPPPQGLYHPAQEHDSCGVNFVVDLQGRATHAIVETGIGALCNLQHRGALGAEINTGDGAGILIQVPDGFFRAVVDFELPPIGEYATGMAFLPQDPVEASKAVDQIEKLAADESLDVLGWREVPVDSSMLGAGALKTMPTFRQIFIAAHGTRGIDLDRRAYVLRKRIEHEIQIEAGADEVNEAMGGKSSAHDGVYFPSLSARTFIYKGMLTTPQLAEFYPDLADERVESAMALVHSRFSTNTFPSWPLAHPFRFVAHNGEINTAQGNQNWMRAREALLQSDHLGEDASRLFPICTPGASDTARFDEALELLNLGGYSLQEAVLMMIPEPWENHESMPADLKAFYRYHASLMEPWDGPASIAFTDGTVVGAVLDRNGLRPSRYWVTDDDLVIMASEVGVVEVPAHKIVEKGRLQPGRMFFVDTAEGRIVRDPEIKASLAAGRPYQEWLDSTQLELDDLADRPVTRMGVRSLKQRQVTFGYTHEQLKLLVAPMVRDSKEAIGSMGTDTPIAVLSDRSRLLYDYFQQLFAQVTNPPLDAMREEIITATCGWLGPEGNLLDPQADSCRQIFIEHPVITNAELAKLIDVDQPDSDGSRVEGFSTAVIPCHFHSDEGGAGLRAAIENVRAKASEAIADGKNLIVLSDRGTTEDLAPIPMLLAVGAVHHHLVREKTRTKVGLIVETGEAREVHHMCLLLGYGATAINPYLIFETIDSLIDQELYGLDGSMSSEQAHSNYIEACDKGVLKVMSKMGISTVKSYVGAQIFEAIGLGQPLVMECFTGTVSRLGGISYAHIAEEVAIRHRRAYPDNPTERVHRSLDGGGEYQWRREGEYHLFNPETVFKLQHATREGRYEIFKEYTSSVDDQSAHLATLRGLFRFEPGDRQAVPLDEVEPVSEIVKRFSTGAMSYGSISAEAHETLAVAMNRIGAKSNTGEGGEDPRRFVPDANGDSRRSSIKQAESGRFGVTSEYLTQADDIQIKMAQGAKPGEGGQLPGHKVWPWIAEVRHSTPGVGLISPPPHHDIYSIEDLAQLIHDLKNANPSARINVKLVSELGVGTVAAGVSKAHADVVLISGHDGGTGASPLTSIKHAGTPWELGLAETQQTLLLNNLRDRIVVQTDGQLKTGRDVVVATLLGAEEFGFATAPLVVMGCVMMRVCHLDTCPVGVATQDPELRKKFTGRPEFVVTFMEYIAEEVREILAELGFRTMEEAIGRTDALDFSSAIDHWKAEGLDLRPILYMPEPVEGSFRYQVREQDHGLDQALDNKLIEIAQPAIADRLAVEADLPINNVNRTVGTMLGHEVTKAWGADGLPDDTIHFRFTGSAGNSFGAFVPRGITLDLTGDANDYVGKGLSGGRIVVRPPADAAFVAEENVIAGNVILYGATGGELFLRGLVGERFCVRNSGATAVVEGVGDHGCEYMTAGNAVILGPAGRNFGAGMSGGTAYVLDSAGDFVTRVNPEMVDLEKPTDEEAVWLEDRVRKHLNETGSEVAERLLADWPAALERFVKVMPKDYKRVLNAVREAEEAGKDVNEAIMAASRG